MQPFEPYDIYDIWYEPIWKTKYTVIIAIIAIMLILLLSYFVLKKRKSKKKFMKPWELALFRFSSISIGKYEEKKEFYIDLTYILKQYLAIRYAIDLQGKTDQEMLESMQYTEFPKDMLERLERIFLGAVMVKFAQEDAVLLAMERDLKRGIDIVRNTIPKM